jgi:hypothetical protein
MEIELIEELGRRNRITALKHGDKKGSPYRTASKSVGTSEGKIM